MDTHRSALGATLVGALACLTLLFCGDRLCRKLPVVGPSAPLGVSGVVLFEGAPPEPSPWSVPGGSTCSHDVRRYPRIAVGQDGGLRDVLVRLKAPALTTPPPPDPVVVTKRGCMYDRRVVALVRGQSLVLRNLDDTIHNVRAAGRDGPYFNQALVRGSDLARTFETDNDDLIEVKCDLHSWETVYVMAMSHRYAAVTGSSGEFTLEDVPAGTYGLEAWHPELGVKNTQLRVAPGETAEATLVFDARDVQDEPAGGARWR